MPQLAFANSFWESYDALEKPVGNGVRKAMQMFQRLTVPELQQDKGLHGCASAAELLAGSAPTHDHVVVDEAQDLHPAQWRVLRGAVAPGSDDLFLTGDPHQRIYDSRVSLGSLGISVAGRTHRLRINYRSTEEILAWSTGILAPVSADDLGGEGSDTLAGYRSLLHGRRPQVVGHGSEQEEVAALVNRVRGWIAQGIAPSEIRVCTRSRTVKDPVSTGYVSRRCTP